MPITTIKLIKNLKIIFLILQQLLVSEETESAVLHIQLLNY